MSDKNPADYAIGPDATIEDADLDKAEIYYQGERLTESPQPSWATKPPVKPAGAT